MIKGLLIFEDGSVQQIGELSTATNIIAAMQQILPELMKQEQERILRLLDTDTLEAILAQRRLE